MCVGGGAGVGGSTGIGLCSRVRGCVRTCWGTRIGWCVGIGWRIAGCMGGGGGGVKVGDGVDDTVIFERPVTGGVSKLPVGAGTCVAVGQQDEMSPFAGFADLIIDVVDGDD